MLKILKFPLIRSIMILYDMNLVVHSQSWHATYLAGKAI